MNIDQIAERLKQIESQIVGIMEELEEIEPSVTFSKADSPDVTLAVEQEPAWKIYARRMIGAALANGQVWENPASFVLEECHHIDRAATREGFATDCLGRVVYVCASMAGGEDWIPADPEIFEIQTPRREWGLALCSLLSNDMTREKWHEMYRASVSMLAEVLASEGAQEAS